MEHDLKTNYILMCNRVKNSNYYISGNIEAIAKPKFQQVKRYSKINPYI